MLISRRNSARPTSSGSTSIEDGSSHRRLLLAPSTWPPRPPSTWPRRPPLMRTWTDRIGPSTCPSDDLLGLWLLVGDGRILLSPRGPARSLPAPSTSSSNSKTSSGSARRAGGELTAVARGMARPPAGPAAGQLAGPAAGWPIGRRQLLQTNIKTFWIPGP